MSSYDNGSPDNLLIPLLIIAPQQRPRNLGCVYSSLASEILTEISPGKYLSENGVLCVIG